MCLVGHLRDWRPVDRSSLTFARLIVTFLRGRRVDSVADLQRQRVGRLRFKIELRSVRDRLFARRRINREHIADVSTDDRPALH